jgi:VWFA-related protein
MTRWIRCAITLLLIMPLAMSGQVKESVTVSVVEVPVTVVDRSGAPVRGLTAANFEVVDEGKKRDITALDAIDFSSTESMKAVSPLNPAARRNFLILFDLSYSSPTSITRAQTAARDFVTKGAQKRDRIAVASIDSTKGFRLLTNFTTDRALLGQAINSPAQFRGSDPLQIASAPLLELPTNQTASGLTGGKNADAVAENMADLARGSNQANAAFKRQGVERQIGMLAGLAKTLRSIAGQKHVIFLSEGFDPSVIQGRESQGISTEVSETNTAVENGEIWKVDNDTRFGNTASSNLLTRMADMFKRSDVILHAVDIAGLRVDNDVQSGSNRKSNEGLFLLANSTGGDVIKNSNDMGSNFDRMSKSQEVVYVLAFNAPTSTPGKFHNLKVKLVNVPGGRIQSRAGYYEAGGENVVERSLSNAEIVLNDIAQNDIHLSAMASAFPVTGGGNAQVPVVLEINGSNIMAAARNGKATTQVMIYAFDEEGNVRDMVNQQMQLDMAKVANWMSSGGIKYYGTLSLPPGNYAIKSLVRVAESDVKGYARRDIVVAKPGEMAISQPIFMEAPGKWLMIKGPIRDKAAAYPFEVNGESFIPSAAVALKNGEPRKFVVFVQNAGPDELSFDVAPQAKLLSQLKSDTGTKLVFQLDGVAASTAALDVTVRKKGGAGERKSTVPIAIVQ